MRTLIGLLVSLTWLSGVLSNQLVQSDPAVIKPGDSHTVTCQGSGGFTFGGYYMHWIRQFSDGKLQWLCYIGSGGDTRYNDVIKGRFTTTRDNNSNKLTLKMDNMKTEDTAVYYCARALAAAGDSWAFDIWGTGTQVAVTSAEKSAPSVFPLVPCCDITSSEITIGCLSTGYLPEPVDVTWNSGSITTGIKNLPGVLSSNGNYISSSYLTISTSNWKSNKYTCDVNHKPSGHKISKDIPECGGKSSPPTVEVMLSSCGVNNLVDLICLISGYAPKDINIKWLQNGTAVPSVQYNNNQYEAIQGNLISSKLSVPQQDWDKGTIYTCEMNHPASSTKEKKIISRCPDLTSKPKIVLHPPSRKDLLITMEPKLTCEVSGITSKLPLKIKWKRSDGKTAEPVIHDSFNDFAGTYTVNSTLKISKSDWDAQVSFTCITEYNKLSPIEQSIKNKRVRPREPIIYSFPPAPAEFIPDQLVGITCRFEGFNHKDIYVGWKENNDYIREGDYINTEPILTDDGETYVMFSRLLVPQNTWNSQATFTCLGGLERISRKEIKIGKTM